ncbi:unnamed protein product, partial [Tetraodon nigroviridis]
MSRRSLRLDDGLLDRNLPHSSSSFSVGGTGWRSSRLLKCRGPRQLSLSCTESLLMDSPHKMNSSDASLLSSLVEDSSIQDNTLVDSIWGLDHETDPKESSIIADQSTILADHTLIGPDDCATSQPVQAVTRFYCQGCEPSTKEHSGLVSPSSCTPAPKASEPGCPGSSTIYSRARKRKTHRAPARHCGVMNLKESSQNQDLRPNGALCDRPRAPREVVVDEESRLERLEQRVMVLWEQVEAAGRWAEQRHREVMQLYTELLQGGGGGGRGEAWLTGLMEQQLQRFRTLLDTKRRQTRQRQSGTSRVGQLELQLQALAAQTEDLQSKQEAVSVGVAPQLHNDVLAQVARLEMALEDISSQIRDEIHTRIHGSPLMGRGVASAKTAPSESFLRWVSQRYVSRADLRVALASLELSILQTIGKKTEGNVGDGTKAALSREDVHVIVENALRRFSEDRTGMPDFALESGGGSILSTRCSETYRTKVALLSLFGFPLWYFSQSPRAVIQPDVHPGNCWAFRGSSGFLVIRLSMPIFPTAITLEHTPKALSPSGKMHSAPRDFSVYGLDDENQERGHLLGVYTYDQDGDAVQTFTVSEVYERPFQLVEVQVTSNWGQPDYTCLYRIRVHGTPAD